MNDDAKTETMLNKLKVAFEEITTDYCEDTMPLAIYQARALEALTAQIVYQLVTNPVMGTGYLRTILTDAIDNSILAAEYYSSLNKEQAND